MLTVHHLAKSQSERIVWLDEELAIPYELKTYARDRVTILASPEYKALHPMGAAPVIDDDGLVLAESAAVVGYVIARHGSGRLALRPKHPEFAHDLYWFHFANGNLQPKMARNMVMRQLALPADNPAVRIMKGRLDRALAVIEAWLGEVAYLPGDFTAADIMTVFSLTTMRIFLPLELSPYPNILAYLLRIGAGEAYRAAMRRADPDMAPLLT